MESNQSESRENLIGILLMVGSMAGFAIEDMIIKSMSSNMPSGQILFMIAFGGFVVFSFLSISKGHKLLNRDILHPAMITRNLGEMIGTAGYILAVILIPLSTASAILQATPIVVALGAAVFLKQSVGWRRWIAITVGFIGVIIIIRPGMESFNPYSMLAVIGVLGLSVRDLATRASPTHVPSIVLSAHGFAAVIPISIMFLAFEGGPVAMNLIQTLYIFAAIFFASAGYFAIVKAMRIGEVAVVTPFRYTRLIFAMIIGIVIFNEKPDFWTYVGASIIILSGLYTIYREQMARRVRNTLPTTPS